MTQSRFGLSVAAVLLLAGCSGPSLPVESTPSPAAIAMSEVTDTPPPATTALTPSAPADECVACHTDKQRLIDTARPEEKVEGESKGVG